LRDFIIEAEAAGILAEERLHAGWSADAAGWRAAPRSRKALARAAR
jgi:hypothetical protein